MSSSTAGSTIGQPLLASEIHTGASASTTGEEADVLRSFAEAGVPPSADAIRQLSLQGELRAVSLRIDAITGKRAALLAAFTAFIDMICERSALPCKSRPRQRN